MCVVWPEKAEDVVQGEQYLGVGHKISKNMQIFTPSDI